MARKHTTNPEPEGKPATDPDDAKREFARRLQHFRTLKGWHQAELARQSGVSRDLISKYERGFHLPSPVALKGLCGALGVQATDIIPAKALSSVLDEVPRFSMQTVENGVWLRVNQTVTMSQASRISAILAESEEGGDD